MSNKKESQETAETGYQYSARKRKEAAARWFKIRFYLKLLSEVILILALAASLVALIYGLAVVIPIALTVAVSFLLIRGIVSTEQLFKWNKRLTLSFSEKLKNFGRFTHLIVAVLVVLSLFNVVGLAVGVLALSAFCIYHLVEEVISTQSGAKKLLDILFNPTQAMDEKTAAFLKSLIQQIIVPGLQGVLSWLLILAALVIVVGVVLGLIVFTPVLQIVALGLLVAGGVSLAISTLGRSPSDSSFSRAAQFVNTYNLFNLVSQSILSTRNPLSFVNSGVNRELPTNQQDNDLEIDTAKTTRPARTAELKSPGINTADSEEDEEEYKDKHTHTQKTGEPDNIEEEDDDIYGPGPNGNGTQLKNNAKSTDKEGNGGPTIGLGSGN